MRRAREPRILVVHAGWLRQGAEVVTGPDRGNVATWAPLFGGCASSWSSSMMVKNALFWFSGVCPAGRAVFSGSAVHSGVEQCSPISCDENAANVNIHQESSKDTGHRRLWLHRLGTG